MKSYIIAAAVLIGALHSTTAFAACRKSNVCDDYGMNCRVKDICDSTLDLPSVGLPPLTLPTTELKPLPSMALPPLGTTRCEYKQVNGRWQNICQ